MSGACSRGTTTRIWGRRFTRASASGALNENVESAAVKHLFSRPLCFCFSGFRARTWIECLHLLWPAYAIQPRLPTVNARLVRAPSRASNANEAVPIADGQTVTGGEVAIQAFDTPGHSG